MPILGILASSFPAASGAFESIASATGTGSSGTITFSSIAGTYQSLHIRGQYRPTTSYHGLYIRINSDTGSNYASHTLNGTGTSAVASGSASQTYIYTNYENATDAYYADLIIDIHDYASTTRNKTVRFFTGVDKNGTGSSITLGSGLWMSTSAITSVSLIADTGSFNTATTFALYGIKGA